MLFLEILVIAFALGCLDLCSGFGNRAKTRKVFANINRHFSGLDDEKIVFTEVGLQQKLDELKRKQNEQNTTIPNIPSTNSFSTTETNLDPDDDSTFAESSHAQNSKKFPLPFLGVKSLGVAGGWTNNCGNFVLKPNVPIPLGVVHFIGGAFVGAAPHLTYKYLLEGLCDAGYVIVATPYRLDMDYVRSCDAILSKFDCVAVELANEYGALPVIGLGHSCGALLQTLITSLFPDAPRALNVLISFNNKPASGAIPLFDELVAPLSEQLMGDAEQSVQLRQLIKTTRKTIGSLFNSYLSSPLSPEFVEKEFAPLFRQAVEIVDQLPPLLDIIASGQREFTPNPTDAKEVCRRMYRARRTLLLKFERDDLDESEEIEKVLKEVMKITLVGGMAVVVLYFFWLYWWMLLLLLMLSIFETSGQHDHANEETDDRNGSGIENPGGHPHYPSHTKYFSGSTS